MPIASASNPLIRSATHGLRAPAWLAGSFQGDGDDGVLTAYEIAQMDPPQHRTGGPSLPARQPWVTLLVRKACMACNAPFA